MRAWSTALLIVAACGFPRPADVPDPAMADASAPADASLCFGSFVRVCFDSAADLPAQPRHWGDDGNDVTVDTDVASVCDQHNDQKAAYCVITGAGMTFAQTKIFRAIGSKPLVLLSTSAVDIRGTLDVSVGGAGADPAGQCTGATPAMGNSGGAGGSFGGRGGNGEQVNAPAGSSTAAPRLARFPASLRGGCAGENGAPSGSGSPGGIGGGAVAIIAPSMALEGAINASGQGALGGIGGSGGAGGGGGGGSGGMIVLDVPLAGIVRGSGGTLFANGGGGGEGADASSGGRPGRSPSAPTPAAPGGGNGEPGNTGNPDGGNGGSGSAGADTDGSASPGGAQPSDGGGGGGGGGGGFIYAPGITGDLVISPPSLDLPQPPV